VRVGSLFAGIGGLELGLERAGMEVIWQVENDPYCIKVLEKHWPEVRRYGDITQIDWREVEAPELVCGGFPCQPVSVAGKRKGTEDERWLWPEFRRCVRELRPRLVLVENVPGLLTHGGAGVLGDLAACGYDAESETLPASAFGAPHLRYRVFLVAQLRGAPGGISYASLDSVRLERERRGQQHGVGGSAELGADGSEGDVADADSARLKERCRTEPVEPQQRPTERGSQEVADTAGEGSSECEEPREVAERGETTRTQRPSSSSQWSVEPNVGRVAHGVPSRVDRLRSLGNAVVPQVAEWIGQRIMEAS